MKAIGGWTQGQRRCALSRPARRHGHRRQRRMARGAAAPALGHPGRLCRSRPAGRHSGHRGLQRRQQRGGGLLRGQQKGGLRWNTAKAFLRPTCYGRPNFELWTHAQVSRLLFEPLPAGGLRCSGAQVWTGSEMVDVQASQEVLLCAGAVNSPQILQLSGIGPGRCCKATASPCATTCPAWARTCRTICRSARSTRSRARARSTPWPIRCGARPASAWSTCCAAAAP